MDLTDENGACAIDTVQADIGHYVTSACLDWTSVFSQKGVGQATKVFSPVLIRRCWTGKSKLHSPIPGQQGALCQWQGSCSFCYKSVAHKMDFEAFVIIR